jgi:peptidoglycan/LPS O-acetylase OafA/YrhL
VGFPDQFRYGAPSIGIGNLSCLFCRVTYHRSLDGLRGIAILLVLLFHADILAMGWMGVQLFFVLSGFLITRLLLDARTQSAATFFGGFYWRRSLRIFPLYFGFLGLAAIAFAFTGHPAGTVPHMPYLATYTFNFDRALVQDEQDLFFRHLWSLSFEEQFYLVWPLLVWLLPSRALRGLVLALVLSAPALRYAIGEWGAGAPDAASFLGPVTYCLPLGHLDGFAFGALVAVLPLDQVKAPQRWLSVCLALFVLAGAGNALAGGAAQGDYLIPAMGYPVASVVNGLHVWGYTLQNLLFAGMVLLAVWPGVEGAGIRRVWAHPALVGLGRISYGVYVLHWPMILGWQHLLPADAGWGTRMLALPPLLALVLGLAWLSHRYFESWFLRQKGRFFPTP